MTVKQLMNREINLPSKEITNRFLSGQVKFNGVKLANPDFEIGEVTNVQELGDFLSFTCSPTALNLLQLLSPDPRLLFGTLDNESVNVQCLRYLAEWNVLQISKKKSWVFKNNQIIEI